MIVIDCEDLRQLFAETRRDSEWPPTRAADSPGPGVAIDASLDEVENDRQASSA
jgi:hypothetical protein